MLRNKIQVAPCRESSAATWGDQMRSSPSRRGARHTRREPHSAQAIVFAQCFAVRPRIQRERACRGSRRVMPTRRTGLARQELLPRRRPHSVVATTGPRVDPNDESTEACPRKYPPNRVPRIPICCTMQKEMRLLKRPRHCITRSQITHPAIRTAWASWAAMVAIGLVSNRWIQRRDKRRERGCPSSHATFSPHSTTRLAHILGLLDKKTNSDIIVVKT
jgi:hypothetical protein